MTEKHKMMVSYVKTYRDLGFIFSFESRVKPHHVMQFHADLEKIFLPSSCCR